MSKLQLDDDLPPPLDELDPVEQSVSIPKCKDSNGEGKTTMELMLEDSRKAQQAKDNHRRQKEKKANKTFGAGLQKGFLSQKSSCKRVKEKVKQIPTIKPKEIPENKFKFPEVQAALKDAQNLNPKEWMTPDLFRQLSQNQRLLGALQDPVFCQAIHDLKTNPSIAMEKYRSNTRVQELLLEFMQILGGHFEELGKKNESQVDPPSTLLPSIDEIQQNAIKNMERTPEEDVVVQKILQDVELRTLLANPEMRQILQQCQQPNKFKQFMQDPVVGPKLRRMHDAGLFHIQT